jgi:hypothetical protein
VDVEALTHGIIINEASKVTRSIQETIDFDIIGLGQVVT